MLPRDVLLERLTEAPFDGARCGTIRRLQFRRCCAADHPGMWFCLTFALRHVVPGWATTRQSESN